MEKLKKYIRQVLDIELKPRKIISNEAASIPFYLNKMFDIYRASLLEKEVLLAIANDLKTTTKQIENQVQNLSTLFDLPVIMVLHDIDPTVRRRLINKKVNFIVPDKQMFLPELLVDLKENYKRSYTSDENLLPSAQAVFIYYLLYGAEHIENYSLKELAIKFHYSPMALTKATHNLKAHGICDIKGAKAKHIVFNKEKKELWNDALSLLVNPVYKLVYTDELPPINALYKSNESALAFYSNIAEGSQLYYAIPKIQFYQLQKEGKLKDINNEEGKYALEVWKYLPSVLTQTDYVDPLSLYLSLKDNEDERIQMALDTILKTYI